MGPSLAVSLPRYLSGEEPAEMDETRLLAAARGGDRAAAEALVERTYASVYAWLVRLSGDKELAADLTQETYRRAWDALPRFEGRSRLTTWLFQIAYRSYLNHKRKPERLASADSALQDPADPAPGADEALSRREVAERLRRAVIGLPEDLRFTVTARFWAEMPVREIARAEGVTSVAIRKRLKRALASLEIELQGDMS